MQSNSSGGEPTPSSEGPIEVAPGENFTSFDELESAYSGGASDKTTEVKQKTIAKVAEKIIDKKGDASKKADEKTPKGSEEKPDPDAEKKVGEDGKPLEEPKPEKLIKMKSGDETKEVSADSTVTVKVAGVDESVTIQDLMNNYSGKTVWEKKFNELDTERRSFKLERDKVTGNIKEVMSLWTDKQDPEMAFYKMIETFGYDSGEYRKDLYNSLMPALENYSNMSESERKQADLEFENKMLKARTESVETTRANEQTQRELDQKVQSLQEAHQIKQADYLDKYDLLAGLKKQGQLQAEVTPEFVAETIVKERVWDAIEPIVKDSAADLDDKGRTDLMMTLVNQAWTSGLTAEDMVSVVRDLYPANSKAKNLSEKVRKAEEERGERTTSGGGATINPSTDPTFFDDLE